MMKKRNYNRIQILILVFVLILGLGCSVQNRLSRSYKGEPFEKVMKEMGKPVQVDILADGTTINLYKKSKLLRAAPINTGQFQYDPLESPSVKMIENTQFTVDKNGIVQSVKFSSEYER